MVSRRNFFTITVIMLVVMFMFQVPEILKDRVNAYGENGYENVADAKLAEKKAADSTSDDALRKEQGRTAVYVGDAATPEGSIMSEWCLYTKRDLKICHSLSDFEMDEDDLPAAIFLDAKYLDLDKDLLILGKLAGEGVNMVFCSLPDVEEIKESGQLRSMLGIREVVEDEVKAEGIRVMKGFLLGGEKEYKLDETMEKTQQDLDLTMPWYRLSAGTEMYMYGMMDDKEMKARGFMENDDLIMRNQNLPAVVWRSSYRESMVFAVNGDYMSGNEGLGILSALFYEAQEYYVYPIINAQNLVVLNFPDLSDENKDEMMRRYSQSLKAVYRDIVWPGLVSVAQQNSYKMTCMIMPQMEYMDELKPEEDMLVYYMKLFREQNAETGLSGTYGEDVGISEKLSKDIEFLDATVPDYAILSFYQGNIPEEDLKDALKRRRLATVRTVFSDYSPSGWMVSYYNWNSIIRQRGVCNGYSHKFSEDLRMVSLQTALGYSNIQVDLNPVAYPSTDQDSWEKLARKFAGNTSTYWKKFSMFDKTTLAESNAHVRKFLSLEYSQHRVKDVISIHLSNFEDSAWLILRTHGEEIEGAVGADAVEIEEDAYLIKAKSREVQLKLKDTNKRYYY